MKSSLQLVAVVAAAIGLSTSVSLAAVAQEGSRNQQPGSDSTAPLNTPGQPRESNSAEERGQSPNDGQMQSPNQRTSPTQDSESQDTTTPNTSGSDQDSGSQQPAQTIPDSQTQPDAQPSVPTPDTRYQSPGQPTSPTPSSPSQSQMQSPNQTGAIPMQTEDMAISEIVQKSPDFELFNALVRVADQNGKLSRMLADSGSYTVFAPTDSAFLALPEGTFRNLVQPENRALLMKVLSYHIIPGEVKSSQIQSGSTDSIAGDSLTLQSNGQSVTVNGAQVIQPDIQASDGVIHAVDRVILPPEVQARLNSTPASTSSLNQP